MRILVQYDHWRMNIWCFLYFWSNLALFCNKVYYWIITFRVLYWCKVAGCRSNVAQIKWTWISHVLQLDIHWLCRIVDDMSYLVLKYLEHCVSLHLSTLLSNFSFPRHVFFGFSSSSDSFYIFRAVFGIVRALFQMSWRRVLPGYPSLPIWHLRQERSTSGTLNFRKIATSKRTSSTTM